MRALGTGPCVPPSLSHAPTPKCATCSPFGELVSHMTDERVLAIADPKDRELICFSKGATFDVNVKILQAVVPAPKPQARATRTSCAGSRGVPPSRGAKEGSKCPPRGTPRGGCG